jgi:hypothetical protein
MKERIRSRRRVKRRSKRKKQRRRRSKTRRKTRRLERTHGSFKPLYVLILVGIYIVCTLIALECRLSSEFIGNVKVLPGFLSS